MSVKRNIVHQRKRRKKSKHYDISRTNALFWDRYFKEKAYRPVAKRPYEGWEYAP